jgi:2,3-bisphosphoglycerate-dependent phosphoglycerate mutase
MVSEPGTLWLLRHGQSKGNVARDEADRAGVEVLELAERDMDVPLSPLGREQAASFGRWLGGLPADRRPDVVVASPYRRTSDTATVALDAAGLTGDVPLRLDERLREREFGILDLLTHRGIEARFPAEAERRRRLGKFYYRAPGGESWADVALRLRSLRDSLAIDHADRRVLVVAHEVPIFVLRYLLEDLDEARALALSRDEPLANCGLTTYGRGPDGRLTVDLVNWTVPLERTDTPVTEEPDAAVAPR